MGDFNDLVNKLIDLILLAIPLVFAVTLLIIVWGVLKAWVVNAGDQNSIENGKQIALAGVIALVVMSSVWAILHLLKSSLF